VATTSFFPAKPLGCYGDGGAIFTSDEELARSFRQIARHGQSKLYHHDVVGMNSRLDTLQAAILLEKLKIFDEELRERKRVAATYSELINRIQSETPGSPVVLTPAVEVHNQSAWAQYTLIMQCRDAVKNHLNGKGIPSVVYYPLPLNQQKAVADNKANVAQSARLAGEVLSLPMHSYLSSDVQRSIVQELHVAIRKFQGERSR
jgi:UDP-2-acetamido-2-deoxy-ribo-hexuluronate aminotransferase